MYIDGHSLLVWIGVGLVAGFLASHVMTGHGFGLIMDIVVGIIGAFLGGFLAAAVGLSATTLIAQLIVAFIGAIVLLMLLRLVGLGRTRRRML
ncbi:MAG: GlsB/YeaQ/YmgE family stress response membrane protein [Chloroflexi bacterium]|nr:MAG: GlsB/YeaQ/YmgE family stress response membrane protein [Chloroflexota bacterium]TME16813.1 MAG: GlsB/YeaQ/YmgE family stress response membrane protein [Chloroflexota bacterium]TME17309.1 MAG: GlsB/YeaQ/YmgE family stress response membrane protein [Chloroflexota bacterium]